MEGIASQHHVASVLRLECVEQDRHAALQCLPGLLATSGPSCICSPARALRPGPGRQASDVGSSNRHEDARLSQRELGGAWPAPAILQRDAHFVPPAPHRVPRVPPRSFRSRDCRGTQRGVQLAMSDRSHEAPSSPAGGAASQPRGEWRGRCASRLSTCS